MKFLIQRINKKIVHDFSFVLIESINYQNWLYINQIHNIKYKFFDTISEQTTFEFKSIHKNYIPVGTVEFVTAFLKHFYSLIPKPMNVPDELYRFAGRNIINGTKNDIFKFKFPGKKLFIKSNDKIKGFSTIIEFDVNHSRFIYININGFFQKVDISLENIPDGNYQISDYVNIESEWRCFVYNNKLVGLQNYSGDFTLFPNINTINSIISTFKSAPIAYTIDVGVDGNCTFIIECHDFFSCGLYGFADYKIYPQMLYKWFINYKNKIK